MTQSLSRRIGELFIKTGLIAALAAVLLLPVTVATNPKIWLMMLLIGVLLLAVNVVRTHDETKPA